MIFHSSFEYYYLWLPLIGFMIGFIGSLLGGGGGFFFIPVLTLIFNVPAQIAVATSLAATLPIGIIGSFGHYRNDNINIRLGLAFALAGILGAIVRGKSDKPYDYRSTENQFWYLLNIDGFSDDYQ